MAVIHDLRTRIPPVDSGSSVSKNLQKNNFVSPPSKDNLRKAEVPLFTMPERRTAGPAQWRLKYLRALKVAVPSKSEHPVRRRVLSMNAVEVRETISREENDLDLRNSFPCVPGRLAWRRFTESELLNRRSRPIEIPDNRDLRDRVPIAMDKSWNYRQRKISRQEDRDMAEESSDLFRMDLEQVGAEEPESQFSDDDEEEMCTADDDDESLPFVPPHEFIQRDCFSLAPLHRPRPAVMI